MKKLLVGMLVGLSMLGLVGCKKIDMSKNLNNNMDDETFLTTYVGNLNEAIDNTKYKDANVVLVKDESLDCCYTIKITYGNNKDCKPVDKEVADMYLKAIKEISGNLYGIMVDLGYKYKIDSEKLIIFVEIDDGYNKAWLFVDDDSLVSSRIEAYDEDRSHITMYYGQEGSEYDEYTIENINNK